MIESCGLLVRPSQRATTLVLRPPGRNVNRRVRDAEPRSPHVNRRRFFERPESFRLIARLDDKRLDRMLAFLHGR